MLGLEAALVVSSASSLQLMHACMSVQTQGKFLLSMCLQQCSLWHLKVQKTGSRPLSNSVTGDIIDIKSTGHGQIPVALSAFRSAGEKDLMTTGTAPKQTGHFGHVRGA